MTLNLIHDLKRTNNAVFLIDLQNQTFCYVNDYACEKLGYSRDELLQMGVRDIDPLIDEASLQKISEQIAEQGFYLLETYHLAKDGRLFPVEVSGNLFDYQGKSFGISIARDMTERNYKEEEKQHLIDILEESADFIGSVDMEGRLLYQNHATQRVMGLADDADLSIMSIADMCPAWVFQLMCETVIPTVMVHGVWRGETAILSQDSHEIPVFQTVVLHRDTDGKPLFISTIMHDLTERKQKDEQLKLLDYAFNHVDEAMFLIDENARFIQVNEKACCSLGYAREELLGMTIFEIDPDYTPQHWQQSLDDVARGVTSIRLESRHQTKNGRIFPIEVVSNRIFYQGQNYKMAMVRDISERKQKEAQLALLDYAFNYVDEGIFLVNSDAQFLQVNEKACLSLGYSREELLSMGIFDIDPDFTHELWQNLLAEHEKGRKSITVETHHRSKGGVVFPVEVSGHYIAYQGQQYSFAMVRDITERKAAEKQLALLNYALDHVKESAWLIDETGNFHYINQEACRSVGYTREEMLQLKITNIGADFPIETWNVHWQELKAKKTLRFEVNHKTKEGHIFPVEVNANYFEFGGKAYNLALSHDITERKRMENELAASEHEFRTLAENVPDNLLRYNLQCRLHYMNPATMLNLAPEAVPTIGKTPSQSFPNNPVAVDIENAIKHAIETGKARDMEIPWLNGNGEIGVHHIRCVAERDSEGTITGVLMIGRDITERKHAEQLLAQREQEFRTLVDNLPTVVLRYNRYLQRIYANPAYLQIMGKSEAELLNKPLEETWMATNISVASYKAILTQVMHGGEKQELLLEWTDSNGELICHALKIVPEYAIDGQIQSALVLGFDFSEQRRQQIIETNRQQVFEKMAHNHSLDTILEQVALYVESTKTESYCAILLMDEAKTRLELVAAPSFPQSYRAKSLALTLEAKSQHCFGWAAAVSCKERIILDNLYEQPCDLFCQNFIRETQSVACWSEPIISSSNQLLGVVTLYLNSAGQPDENDLALLVKAAHLSAIAIERKRIEQQMAHQASYDALTELPNRRLFHNRLQEEISKAKRKGHHLAVLFIDLDHFKDVNDTLGHQIGDNLLVHAAWRIQSCVRQSDTVARLGGDEFVVILPELGKVPLVERIAEAIIRTMTQPFKLGEYHTYVSASVGIAMYPEDADNAETLVSCADQAMYAAKESGRSSFNFFRRSMQEQAQQRLYLVNSLRDALEKNQFEVYYQPIIEVSSGKAVKAEALLRWHHPVLGIVSPAVFIPLAEETDLIQGIGSWVFCQAADMAKRWNTLSGVDELRKVSINMSPRQLIKGSGDQIAIDYLQAIDLDSSYIVVEITEGLLLDDSPNITEKLERLRAGGIELSLDDFGTGYSAMAYLKKFDINYLKIDRSFVHELETNLNDRAITEAIVMMAHRLGLKVIAEGVETEGQRALLAAVGCEYIQGYLYAKPMPTEVFFSYALE